MRRAANEQPDPEGRVQDSARDPSVDLVGSLPVRRRALFAVVTLVAPFLVGLPLLELAARWREERLAAAVREPAPELPLLRDNPSGAGSFRLRPGLDVTARVDDYEVRIRTNNHGMHWRELPLAKPAGEQRIAFLGDSFTFGCWADRVENSFVGVFERDVSPTRFGALNFGVGGYGLADMELQLDEQVLAFSPDFVIVVMFNGNDFRDTWLGLHKDRIVDGMAVRDEKLLRSRVPSAHLAQDGVVSQPAPESSRLLRTLSDYATWRLLAPLFGRENLAIEFRPSARFISYTFWSRHPYPDVALQAVDASLATLERMHRSLDSRGIRMGIVMIPTRDQVYSTRAAGRDFDTDLPQAFVRLFARQRGIPFLDLLPPLREEVVRSGRRLYARHDQHFNNAGHEVAGLALADWFRCCVRRAAFAER